MVSMQNTVYVDDIREIKEENPFESMMSRFDRAAQLLNLDPDLYAVMRVPNREKRMTTDLRPPDAVARQRRRARRWHAIVRRLLEGIPEPDQPWLRKRRAREGDGLGKRIHDRRIVRRSIRIGQNKSSGHCHARKACFRRRRREVVPKRENRIDVVGRSFDAVRPVVNRIQGITRDRKVKRSIVHVAQRVGTSR